MGCKKKSPTVWWVEGADGNGKTSVITNTVEVLEDHGYSATSFHFPSELLAKYIKFDNPTDSDLVDWLSEFLLAVYKEFSSFDEEPPDVDYVIFDRSPISTLVYNVMPIVWKAFRSVDYEELKLLTISTTLAFSFFKALPKWTIPSRVFFFIKYDETNGYASDVDAFYGLIYDNWGVVRDLLTLGVSSEWIKAKAVYVNVYDVFEGNVDDLIRYS